MTSYKLKFSSQPLHLSVKSRYHLSKDEIMILIYSNTPYDKDKIEKQKEILKERLNIFFVEDNHFLFSTETNQQLLRESILNHKVFLFYTHSITEMGFSPTEISELIIFLLKNKIHFQSESENLYLSDDKIEIVYPTIFEIFRKKF